MTASLIREEAIELLMLDMANPGLGNPRDTTLAASGLRTAALLAVWSARGYNDPIEDDCLEAAALLRDGWNPSDPVHRLK